MRVQVAYGKFGAYDIPALVRDGGHYVYEVDDPVVGMHVLCPPSWVPGSTVQVGTVVALDSGSYQGPVKRATKVIS